jgi:hypothetical protein
VVDENKKETERVKGGLRIDSGNLFLPTVSLFFSLFHSAPLSHTHSAPPSLLTLSARFFVSSDGGTKRPEEASGGRNVKSLEVCVGKRERETEREREREREREERKREESESERKERARDREGERERGERERVRTSERERESEREARERARERERESIN